MLPAMAATHQGAWLDHRPLLHSDSVQQPAQSVTAGKDEDSQKQKAKPPWRHAQPL